MGLKRFLTAILWDNVAVAAGAQTGSSNVSEVEFIGAFIKVSAATTITIQTTPGDTVRAYDQIVFPAAGEEFINIWSWPFPTISFKTSAAVTITIILTLKT